MSWLVLLMGIVVATFLLTTTFNWMRGQPGRRVKYADPQTGQVKPGVIVKSRWGDHKMTIKDDESGLLYRTSTREISYR